ncbi:TPA: hypothetical protein QCO88_004979 [Bacillus cereus]|uniref:hypothetical protein n=1 Tax=Bacillus sp. FSL M8-0139 TaxID=2921613 RepID=UPI0030F98E70|nr:hypothetical protein [Bacillus cereus]
MFFINTYGVILFSCLFSLISPLTAFAKAEMNIEQRLFISFENKVSDLVITGMELLSNLDKMNGEISEEELYNLALNVGEEFSTRSKILNQIKVPEKLSDNVQSSLEVVKRDLSIGFTELEEGMLCFAKYLAGRDQTFYDEYIQKKNTGLRYIDGGLTSLYKVSLKLDIPVFRLNIIKKDIVNLMSG